MSLDALIRLPVEGPAMAVVLGFVRRRGESGGSQVDEIVGCPGADCRERITSASASSRSTNHRTVPPA